MSTVDLHVTIIVPANIITQLRKVGQVLGRPTDGMFLTGLSATGEAPATHYISSGKIFPRFVNGIRANHDGLYDFVVEKCTEAGIGVPYTRTQVKNALANVDVSTDAPFEAMARLGLQQVRGTLP